MAGEHTDVGYSGGLANRVVRGTFWIATSSIFTHALYFIRTVILIRLLSPLDFGLMGIGRVVVDMFNRFSETGIGTALVQKKEFKENTLSTAWIMLFIRGAILFTMFYLFVPLISRFYNNQPLNSILKIISLAFIFDGLASIGVFLFVRELNFKNKVIYEQSNTISSTIVSITLAIIYRNVWALVIGYIVGSIIGSLFSYLLHPFRPSLKFDLKEASKLFAFGKYVFGSVIIAFFVMRGPDALVGKVLGLDSLGFYVIAFGIANAPTTSVTHLFSQIVLPAYAKLQNDLPKLRDGYLKVTRLITFLSAPIAGGIVMLIPEFVKIFLGIRWMPIILPVRILCIMGFFRSVASTVSPVFYGIGRPDLEFKLACLNATLLAIFIYPFTVKMGIVGTSMAFSIVSAIAIFFIMRVIYKLIRLDAETAQFLKALFFPLIGTVLMCVSIYLIKLIFSYSLIMKFSVSILIGGVLYISILYMLDKYFGYGLISTVRFAVDSFRKRR